MPPPILKQGPRKCHPEQREASCTPLAQTTAQATKGSAPAKRQRRIRSCGQHLVEEVLHLVQRPGRGGAVLHPERAAERLDRLTLRLGQLLRRLHHDLHNQVAAAALIQIRHALAPQPERPAALRAFGNLQRRLAFQRLDRNFRSQCRLREGDDDRKMQIMPFALEVRVRLYCQHNVEIASIATVTARIAFALVADARAILNARRNLHLDGVLLLHAPFTDAGMAWFDDHLASSAADGAGACDGEETLLEAHLPAAAALLANRRRLALRGAGAAALPANVHALAGDRRLLAEDRLLELDRQVIADIAAALCARCPPAASPGNVEHLSEKVPEDIADIHAAW